jgi:hypothetical protein
MVLRLLWPGDIRNFLLLLDDRIGIAANMQTHVKCKQLSGGTAHASIRFVFIVLSISQVFK